MNDYLLSGALAPDPSRGTRSPGPAMASNKSMGLGAKPPSWYGRQSIYIALLLFGLTNPAHAQWAVFDAANFSQNVMTAARELQQISNQIQSLQNEATMLQNMARNLQSLNLSSLGQMTSALSQINTLMNQANGIAFNVTATDTAFQQQFPSQYSTSITSSQAMSNAQTNWLNAMSAYRQTMLVQAQVDQNVQADAATLAGLVGASQGAAGALQAQQASNQLIALSTQQQMQIQSLLAAEFRAEALDQARRAQSQAAARAAMTRFFGSGSIYTPQ